MQRNFLQKAVFFLSLVTILIFSTFPVQAEATHSLPVFADFVTAVTNDQAGVVRGVYVPDVLADPVIQQPADNPGYVSTTDGILTQFGFAARNGIVGLLAHNFLAGARFYDLAIGQQVWVVYGDGRVAYYIITQIDRYQVLQPNRPSSDYMDLNSGVTYVINDVFLKYYSGDNHVTFQTCILQNGISSWGRMFIIAQPSALFLRSEVGLNKATWK